MREEDSVSFLQERAKSVPAHRKGTAEPWQKWGEKEEHEQATRLDLLSWQRSQMSDTVGSTRNRDTIPAHVAGSNSKN